MLSDVSDLIVGELDCLHSPAAQGCDDRGPIFGPIDLENRGAEVNYFDVVQTCAATILGNLVDPNITCPISRGENKAAFALHPLYALNCVDREHLCGLDVNVFLVILLRKVACACACACAGIRRLPSLLKNW